MFADQFRVAVFCHSLACVVVFSRLPQSQIVGAFDSDAALHK